MSKMKGIRNSYVEVFKKFARNTRQHCYTKFGKKTQNRHIQVGLVDGLEYLKQIFYEYYPLKWRESTWLNELEV